MNRNAASTPAPSRLTPTDEARENNSSFSSASVSETPQTGIRAAQSFPPPMLSWQSPDLAKTNVGQQSDFLYRSDAMPRGPSKKQSNLFSNRLILAADDRVDFGCGHEDELGLDGDDDEEEVDSPVRIGVARTRLDFNVVMDESKPNGSNPSLNVSTIDLSVPYEQRRVSSFPSTVTSDTPLRNMSGFDEMTAGSSSGLTPSRSAANASMSQSSATLLMPASPDEVKFKSKLDAAQCSPIPTDGDGTTDFDCRMDIDASSTSFPTSGNAPGSKAPAFKATKNKLHPPNHSQSQQSLSFHKVDGPVSPRLSVSQSSESSSSSGGKPRRLRPMPDMSAFDAGMSVRSGASSRM